MSDPRYMIDRTVAAPPETVLAAIRDAAAMTPRAALPPAQQRGVRGLRGRVRGTRFTVRMDESAEGGAPGLHGSVLPAGEGESAVRASVVPERTTGAIVLGLLVFAGVYALAGLKGGWTIVIVAVFLAIAGVIRNAAGLMDHGRAVFLVQWLNEVLDTLPPAPLQSPVTPRALNPESAVWASGVSTS